jgi:hypothetical protein
MKVPESYPHRDNIRCKTCLRSARRSCRPGDRSACRLTCESNPHPISVRRRHSPASASENHPRWGNVRDPHVTEEASHRRRRPHGRTRRIHIYLNRRQSRRAGARLQTQHRRSVRGPCRLCTAPSDIRYTKISSDVGTFDLPSWWAWAECPSYRRCITPDEGPRDVTKKGERIARQNPANSPSCNHATTDES